MAMRDTDMKGRRTGASPVFGAPAAALFRRPESADNGLPRGQE